MLHYLLTKKVFMCSVQNCSHPSVSMTPIGGICKNCIKNFKKFLKIKGIFPKNEDELLLSFNVFQNNKENFKESEFNVSSYFKKNTLQ